MGSGYCSPNHGKDHTRRAPGSAWGHGSTRPDYKVVENPNEVLAHESGGAYRDLGDPQRHPFHVGTLFLLRDPSVLHLLILYSKTPGGERRCFRVGINKHQNNGGWSGWDEEVHVYLVHTFQHPRL